MMNKTTTCSSRYSRVIRWGAFWLALLMVLVFLPGSVLAEGAEQEPATDTQDAPAVETPEGGDGEGTAVIDRTVFDTQLPDGFRKVAENSHFRMYIEDAEYNVAVEDIRSGSFWYTSPPEREAIEGITGAGGLAAGSHLIVNYFDTSTQSAGSVNSLLGAVRQKSVKVSNIKNGVRIDFDFSRSKEGFSIPLELVLTDTGLAARVLFEEIDEYSEVLITNIAVLPYFGVGTTADEGYMLIPDGSGGIVDFNSGLMGMSVFSREVYGRDLALTTLQRTGVSEEILLPVFGIRKNDFGMVCYISEGAGSAIFTASPAGISGPLNYAYMTFCYRKTDNIVLADNTWTPRDVVFIADEISQRSRVEMQYVLLDTEDANLGGMAEAYRKYLQTKGLSTLKDAQLHTYVSVYGAVKKTKYFLGIPYTSIQPLTTYAQAQEIAGFIRESADLPLVMQYHGAMKGGMDDAVPTKFTLEGKLGGSKGFKSLLADAEQNGYDVLPDIEFLRITKQRFGWWFFLCGAKNISRQALVEKVYKTSVFFGSGYRSNFLAAHKLMPAMNSFLKSAGKYSLTGLSLSSLGNTVYSNFDSYHVADEDTMIQRVQEALKTVGETYGGNVMVSGATDYAALYADHIIGVPVSDSGYDITAYRVPFYQMVFNGYVNMASAPLNGSANYTESFLLCIETGTAPSFTFTYEDTSQLENTAYETLTSTKFEAWKEDAKEAYQQYAAVFSGITDRRIVGYEMLTEKLRKTVYGDGTTIYVNYDTQAATYGDITVPAQSYVVKSGT